jgi:hypothetical protein
MRFINYLAFTAAILGGHFDVVHGTVSPQTVTGAPVSGDEFVHDVLSVGPSLAQFAAGSPGVALFIQRNLRRPGSAESIGVANIINVPHFVFAESMSAEEIRAHLSRTFAVIRNTLARHSDFNTILINGEGSFGSWIAASPAPIQETIRGMLNEVIHATFDDLDGVTIQLNNIPFVHGVDDSGATYVSTPQIMGPQALGHMGRSGRLATTLIVNVYSPSSSSQDFNAVLSRLIQGGLTVPEGIPDVVVGVPSTTASASAESLLASTEVVEESNTGDHHSELTEEEQAQIAAAIVDFDDAQLNVQENPVVRPADQSRRMRLIGDEDEVAPYNPSSTLQVTPPRPPAFTDLEDDTAYRRAIEESLASSLAVGGGYEEDDEEQMLAAAIESSMQRPPPSPTPEAGIDVNSIIVGWLATESTDVSELIALLLTAGLDEETSLAIAEQYL